MERDGVGAVVRLDAGGGREIGRVVGAEDVIEWEQSARFRRRRPGDGRYAGREIVDQPHVPNLARRSVDLTRQPFGELALRFRGGGGIERDGFVQREEHSGEFDQGSELRMERLPLREPGMPTRQ